MKYLYVALTFALHVRSRRHFENGRVIKKGRHVCWTLTYKANLRHLEKCYLIPFVVLETISLKHKKL